MTHSDEPGEMPPEPATGPTPASSMWGRAGTVVIGLLLLLLGLAMLDPAEFAQTNTQVGLASALAALGMGIVATILLPHSLEVSGKQFKPLGLDVKASGGAAVFIVVLAFVYFSNDKTGGKAEGASPETAETRPAVAEESAAPTGQESAVSTPTPAPVPSPATQAYYYAETFCSDCCPDPSYCNQVGYGEGSTIDRARQRAIEQCYAAGGGPTCANNVRVSLVDPDDF